jgi:hypothetical protein
MGQQVVGVLRAVLTAERVQAVVRVAPVLYLISLAIVYIRNLRYDPEHGLLLASDFYCFWLAAKAAVSVDPALVYDNRFFLQYGGSLFQEAGLLHFFYPPTFLLLTAPLGYIPEIAAFLVFFGASLAGYAYMGRHAFGSWIGGLYLIALPTTFFAIFHGQNSLLLCALLGGALVAIRSERYVLAGILIGCLTIKPQIGLLIPFALLAGRYWTVVAVAIVTTLSLALASWVIFGTETWIAFVNQTLFANEIVNHEDLPFVLHVTPFTSLQQLGVPYQLAMSIQIALVIALLALTAWTWRQDVPFDLKAAVLGAAALLATPYLLSYDLALLAVPFIFLLNYSRSNAFSGLEKWTIAAAIAFCILSKIVNLRFGIPLGPVAPALFLGLASRRVFLLRAEVERIKA